MAPSAESTMASVAVSGSRNSKAVWWSPTVLPTVWASAAAAMNADTSMTFSILRVAKASCRAAASTGSVQVTPVDVSAWPASVAPSRVPKIAEITWSAALSVAASSSVAMSNLLSSMVTPSAFSPSTSSIRTDVGAIDTPSTISTAPPKPFAARHGLGGGTPRPALYLDGRRGGCATLQPKLSGPYEVLIRARRRRSALALVLRSGSRAPVGVLGRAGQPQDAQLTDLHPRPQCDR